MINIIMKDGSRVSIELGLYTVVSNGELRIVERSGKIERVIRIEDVTGIIENVK